MSRKCLRKLIVQQRVKATMVAAAHGGRRHENGSAHAMNGERERHSTSGVTVC